MSRTMVFGDLRRILVECAGLDEGVEFSEAVLDIELTELGYDSLALLETAARIKVEFGVHIPDDEIAALETPRAMLDRVNSVAPIH